MNRQEQEAFDRGLDEYFDGLKADYDAQQLAEGPHCVGCKKRPDELLEYTDLTSDGSYASASAAVRDDGTFNPTNGHFWCMACYIKAGMPLGVAP